MPKNFYPTLILILFGAFLLFSVWSAMRASTLGTQVTDRDYYNKGLKYNSTLIEKRAAGVIGWSLKTQITNHQLQIQLRNSEGQAVAGAVGQLSFFKQIHGQNLLLSLTETAAGTYQVELPADLQGELNVRIDFEYRGARINRLLLLNI